MTTQAGFYQTFAGVTKSEFELEATRPNIKWPDSFEFAISTDDVGLNITEVVYFVSFSHQNIFSSKIYIDLFCF